MTTALLKEELRHQESSAALLLLTDGLHQTLFQMSLLKE